MSIGLEVYLTDKKGSETVLLRCFELLNLVFDGFERSGLLSIQKLLAPVSIGFQGYLMGKKGSQSGFLSCFELLNLVFSRKPFFIEQLLNRVRTNKRKFPLI